MQKWKAGIPHLIVEACCWHCLALAKGLWHSGFGKQPGKACWCRRRFVVSERDTFSECCGNSFINMFFVDSWWICKDKSKSIFFFMLYVFLACLRKFLMFWRKCKWCLLVQNLPWQSLPSQKGSPSCLHDYTHYTSASSSVSLWVFLICIHCLPSLIA